MNYTLIYDTNTGVGIGSHAYMEPQKKLPAGEVSCTADQAANPSQYSVLNGVVVSGSTLAQKAIALLAGGLTINSTGTPSINGVYACDEATQARITKVWALLKQNNDAFPSGVAQISWPLADGTNAVFTGASTLINVFQAIGSFVVQCDEVALTNAGTLPSASATIA